MSPLLTKDEELCTAYRQLGYRLLTTEPLFAHSLERIPRVRPSGESGSKYEIKQVRDTGLAERFATASGAKVLRPEHLEPGAPFRQYVAIEGEQLLAGCGVLLLGECMGR